MKLGLWMIDKANQLLLMTHQPFDQGVGSFVFGFQICQSLKALFELLSPSVLLLGIPKFFELISFFNDAFNAIFQLRKAFIFGSDFKLIADSAYKSSGVKS